MDASSIHVGKDLKDLIHWTHNTDDRMIPFPVRARSSSPNKCPVCQRRLAIV